MVGSAGTLHTEMKPLDELEAISRANMRLLREHQHKADLIYMILFAVPVTLLAVLVYFLFK